MSYEAWLRGDNVDASKTIFVAIGIIVFDFELFIGAWSQKLRADNFLNLRSHIFPISGDCNRSDYWSKGRWF